MRLTIVEIDTLIEAMDAWIDKDSAGLLMGGLLESMLMRDDPEAKSSFADRQAAKKREADYERRQRGEVAVMIKAKLITMRRELEASQDLVAR